MSADPVRFGVLGAGRIARDAFGPAAHVAEGAELYAVASRDPERARSMNPTRVHESYEALLDDPEVEVVYVAAHNGLHRSLSIAALERGKHVLCEKPLGKDAAECEEMIAAASKAGRHLVEAFMYRHHPQWSRARERLAAGDIGTLRTVEAAFSFHLTRSDDVRLKAEWGGGGLMDVGCYCVNVCRLFLGDEPVEVVARGWFDPAHGVDTSFHGVLDYGGGLHGLISCGFDSGLRNRVLLSGTDGTMELPSAFIGWRDGTELIVRREGDIEREVFPPNDMFQREIEDLAVAIRGEGTPLLGPEEGLKNARILDALLASARAVG